MPLPSSGPISFNEIQTEFGGSNPISLSEYYGVDTGVPASGTISVSDFYGTSAAPSVTLGFDQADYAGSDSNPFSSTATFTMNRNGDALTGGNLVSESGDYLTPNSTDAGDAFEVRLALTGGSASSLTGPALNTWWPLTQDRQWTLSTGTSANFQGTVSVREIANTSNFDTATVTLTAAVSGGGPLD